MQQEGEHNRAKLRLVGSTRSPREQLHIDVAEAVNALHFPRGKARPRLVAKTGGLARKTVEMPARLLDDVIDARVPGAEELAKKIGVALVKYVAQKTKRPMQDTGEFRPAA